MIRDLLLDVLSHDRFDVDNERPDLDSSSAALSKSKLARNSAAFIASSKAERVHSCSVFLNREPGRSLMDVLAGRRLQWHVPAPAYPAG